MFFDAASKSVASIPSPGAEVSKQALSFTEQNIKAALDHARKLAQATDLQQAMQIQSEFLKSQFTNAVQQITGEIMSSAKDAFKRVSSKFCLHTASFSALAQGMEGRVFRFIAVDRARSCADGNFGARGAG